MTGLRVGILAVAAVLLGAASAWARGGVVDDRADAWERGAREGVVADGERLALAKGADAGTFISAPLEPAAPFDRACPSWNVDVPGGSSVAIALAVRREGDAEWSAWMPFGTWREAPAADAKGDGPRSEKAEAKGLRVAVDTLIIEGTASAVRYRLELRRGDGEGAPSPRVRRVAVATWKKGEREPFDATPSAAWGRELAVPHRAQGWEHPDIAGRICSPTSLAMVMAFWGEDRPTADVCRRVHDDGAAIYGNWSFNAAAAGSLGFDARVDRFASLRQLEREIEAGRPVIISHQWGEGELQGAPVATSDGHLIVVIGFTEDGDVIVNDPAANPRRGNGPGTRVYRRRDIYRTWLENASGIVYRVHPEE